MGVHDLCHSCSGLSEKALKRCEQGYHGLEDGLPKASIAEESADQALLTPYSAGIFELDIRMVYAPLTRCRALGKPETQKHFSPDSIND